MRSADAIERHTTAPREKIAKQPHAKYKRAGEGAFAAESIDQIGSLLGNDFRRKLKPQSESRWSHDPFARGSYSHALPGHAGKRAVLAAPIDGRLFFAGEATSPGFFSTAHGARDFGERAAGEVIRARIS
jgi:monoamine oxidase